VKNRIKEMRGRFGLTQELLAEKVGVSRQTIIAIENGRYNPSLALAYRLARVFSCRIEDLFEFSAMEGDNADGKV